MRAGQSRLHVGTSARCTLSSVFPDEVSTRVAEQVGFVRGVNLSSEKMGLSYKNRVGQHEWSEFMLEFITHLLGVERMGAVNGT